MTSPEEFKEKFYNNLREVLWRAPCTDKLIIAADFDARVGKEDKWPCVIGPRGVSKCNSHSELLLGLSSEHNLVITNILNQVFRGVLTHCEPANHVSHKSHQ